LHPKFYSPIFSWDVESFSNYAKKLKLTGIAATTLHQTKLLRGYAQFFLRR
jgi:hypothetical protein